MTNPTDPNREGTVRGILTTALRAESLSDPDSAELARLTSAHPAAEFFGVTTENAAEVVRERWGDLAAFAADLVRDALVLTDQRIEIPFGAGQLWHFYLPLARWLFGRWGGGERRFLVGVTGIGASGKSMFCELLSVILGRMLAPEGVCVKTLPLDGYHYPNRHLGSHEAVGPDGTIESLRVLKGMVMTYDAAQAKRDLCRLRSGEKRLLFPAYSRVLHDPVEGEIAVADRDRIVFVEGNYILLDEGDWDAVRRLFDVAIFMEVPRSAARAACVARLARGQWTEATAAERYDRVDAHNADLILSSKPNADVIVERDDAFQIVNVRRNPARRGAPAS